MNMKINNIKKTLQSMQMKVVEVTKTNYTLENGDVYAAMNILLEGERIIGVRSTEFTLVENPTVDDRGIAS